MKRPFFSVTADRISAQASGGTVLRAKAFGFDGHPDGLFHPVQIGQQYLTCGDAAEGTAGVTPQYVQCWVGNGGEVNVTIFTPQQATSIRPGVYYGEAPSAEGVPPMPPVEDNE